MIDKMLKAYEKATSHDESLLLELLNLRDEIMDLTQQIGGSKVRSEVGEKNEYPSIYDYIWKASNSGSTYGPTEAKLKSLANAQKLYDQMFMKIKTIIDSITPMEDKLKKIGAPQVKK